MTGAFAIFFLLQTDLPFLVAVLLGCGVVFLIGIFVQMVMMRPIMDGPHLSVSMLALAVGFVLRGIARLNWGAVPMSLPRPYPQTSFMLGPISITSDDLFIALVTILLFSVLTVLLRWLSFGKVIQAIFQTRRGASLLGINVPLAQEIG